MLSLQNKTLGKRNETEVIKKETKQFSLLGNYNLKKTRNQTAEKQTKFLEILPLSGEKEKKAKDTETRKKTNRTIAKKRTESYSKKTEYTHTQPNANKTTKANAKNTRYSIEATKI